LECKVDWICAKSMTKSLMALAGRRDAAPCVRALRFYMLKKEDI
jgi:hypothetical protein